MKLLFFISNMQVGGAERVISILCNSLSEQGYEVCLATNTDKFFAYTLCENVQIRSLYPACYEKKSFLSRFFQLYASIRKIVKEVNPDVVISFTYVMNAKVLLATRGLEIPVIACERTTLNVKMSFLNKVRRLYISRLADCLTVQTQYDYRHLGSQFPRKLVMPNPLDFPLRYEKNLKRNIVLTVGSVDRWEDKGFGGLIELWGPISKKYPDWELQIAGDGNEDNFRCLRELVERNQVGDSVKLLGYCGNVCDLMYRSAVFVLASRQEGMPNCLMEAMSQGCACISFDCVAGPNEIITQNVSGILVADQDFDEMEETIGDVVGNEDLRDTLARNAIKEVKRFTIPEIMPLWMNLFNRLNRNKR